MSEAEEITALIARMHRLPQSMASPFAADTVATLRSCLEKYRYKGRRYELCTLHYHCPATGYEFTTTETDSWFMLDMMAIYLAHGGRWKRVSYGMRQFWKQVYTPKKP